MLNDFDEICPGCKKFITTYSGICPDCQPEEYEDYYNEWAYDVPYSDDN